MRIIYCFLLLFLGTSITMYAQSDKTDKYKDIAAHRVAYITERLNLSIEEAQKFWPLYNAHVDKIKALKKRDYIKEEVLTDSNAQEFLEQKLTNEQEIIKLKSDFYRQAEKIISYKRIYLLEKAEYEFRHKLLARYKQKK